MLSCNAAAAMVLDVYEGGLTNEILKVRDKYQRFTAGQPKLITFAGTLPSSAQPGDHSLSLGVYSTGLTTIYAFGAVDVTLEVS